MSFASPAFLWALLALPLLAALELWATARDRDRTALLVARPLWGRVVERPAAAWRWARLALLLLGAAGVVVALARPQWGIVREKVEREGVDVVLVLDASGSMSTEDVQPNRFFLARNALLSLVTRLAGDRFALVAFEGEAYPLVPLTLDADAIGLFLDTVEPGIVPAPGTSLGAGLVRGLELFVDPARNNKVMVLVSDGEDLEGEVEAAVAKAREMGVVIHAVGVGTAQGAPVPDLDENGARRGFKQGEDGSPHVSRLDARALEAVARATGGVYLPLSPADTSLWQVAAAIEGMEQKMLAREYSYRKKERYQIPLAVAVAALTLGLALPPPRLRRRRAAAPPVAAGGVGTARAAAAVLAVVAAAAAGAEESQRGSVVDEALLRPQRLNAQGREQYTDGDHPQALASFEQAVARRPADARLRFNLADALYKNGKYQEAVAAFQALAGDAGSPLAAPARHNLGNALFQQGNYPGAVAAYRGALELAPDDLDTRRNLELALRAIEEQKQQEKQQQQQDKDKQDRDDKNQQQQQQQNNDQQKQDQQQQQQRPKSEQEKEQQRFQDETGMSKERAMQLLDALQRAEKDEQKKQLAAQRAGKKKGKDW
jgi:Ca-activated chloride channel family protein